MPEKRKKTIDAAADRQTMTEFYETYRAEDVWNCKCYSA